MTVNDQREAPEFDEGSWVYLSTGAGEGSVERDLVEKMVEACAKSGWRTVRHPPPDRNGGVADPGRYFASVSHAVEHADVVVAMIGDKDEIADAELTLAYSHGRPVVGVQIGEAPLDTRVTMLLAEYERARIVTCSSPTECAVSLQKTLSDPAFVETIRQAW
jgi:sugar/nucleoside kinase (ribokinase family)